MDSEAEYYNTIFSLVWSLSNRAYVELLAVSVDQHEVAPEESFDADGSSAVILGADQGVYGADTETRRRHDANEAPERQSE